MNPNEQDQARIIFEKLTTPLDANGNAELAKRFLRGGFGQEGFGVAEGAAISGSFALAGNQGYYAHHPKVGGKQVFFENVSYLREFFSRRGKRIPAGKKHFQRIPVFRQPSDDAHNSPGFPQGQMSR